MADESKYPTRIAPYGLRMPDDLKGRVQTAADANNRSMNAEIVATLEEKYPAPKQDLSLSELNALLAHVLQAETLEDFEARLKKTNEQIQHTGAELIFSGDRSGRSTLLLRPAVADPDHIASLISAVLTDPAALASALDFGQNDNLSDTKTSNSSAAASRDVAKKHR